MGVSWWGAVIVGPACVLVDRLNAPS